MKTWELGKSTIAGEGKNDAFVSATLPAVPAVAPFPKPCWFKLATTLSSIVSSVNVNVK